ncbi:MAG TPA: hypothetical protein QKA08_04275 [Candidatus Megaira endosymbiont of Nemacystus decipiens]|nr:hypothetical protein [Candidatus Megaera endosymbiont of Nemacystus decipiens]
MTFPDIVGLIGVSFVILAFFFLQIQKIRPESTSYLMLNFFGALFLLYSLFYSWNTASVIIEFLWLGISTYGIVKYKIMGYKL